MRPLISFGLWAFGFGFFVIGVAALFLGSEQFDFLVLLAMAGTLVLSGLLLAGLSAIIDTLLEIRDRLPATEQGDSSNFGHAAVSLRRRMQGDE